MTYIPLIDEQKLTAEWYEAAFQKYLFLKLQLEVDERAIQRYRTATGKTDQDLRLGEIQRSIQLVIPQIDILRESIQSLKDNAKQDASGETN
ncbi:MAG: hypothetical protein ACLGJB_17770 [Blastocatellia bacterium]